MSFRPDLRTGIGLLAGGLYVWRVQDPKGAYAVFYDVTDWLTAGISALFVADDAMVSFIRKALNLVLVDQVEGFLIGIAVATLISTVFWPVRACGRLAARTYRRIRKRRQPQAAAADWQNER